MKKHSLKLLFLIYIFVFACSKSSTNNEDVDSIDKSGNLLATGASANDLLSNANFNKLHIEIAHVVGFRPTDESMNDFVEYVKKHTFKQEIELIYKELPTTNEEELTLTEIDNLEKENRTAYNNENTIAVYIYFADAPSIDDDEDQNLSTLGAVYRNTSMIIYESTVRKLANLNSSISISSVETATLNHEFGHLLGLVNLGTTPVNVHEDVLRDQNGNIIFDNNNNPIGNNHCNVPNCLMRAELEFQTSKIAKTYAKLTTKNNLKAECAISGKNVLKILKSALSAKVATIDLDSECVLDLQSNGGR